MIRYKLLHHLHHHAHHVLLLVLVNLLSTHLHLLLHILILIPELLEEFIVLIIIHWLLLVARVLLFLHLWRILLRLVGCPCLKHEVLYRWREHLLNRRINRELLLWQILLLFNH
jgi:hypothetical protein